ncbi:MAG: type II toxin-antitoxin system RelB/DinJ family antitoxin [Methylovulum miyakonense]|uniref:type II toxin-antitoxin system RelB/DinJ family antitoxin n=1 Tax=Methylovulum miyakonense TaxID=645578 RepID=UPI003BB50F33
MSHTMLHTSIDTEIDAQARLVLSNLGLSMDDAITLFLTKVAENKNIPFSIDLPNQETLAAIEDAHNGRVHRYASLDAMWADLDNE